MTPFHEKFVYLNFETMLHTYVNIHTHYPSEEAICPSQAGIHPWHAGERSIDIEAMRRADMIGEIGLDYVAQVDRSVQDSVFREQLAIAEELGKPVVLHCVKAFEPMMNILAGYDLHGAVFHGFIGSPEQAAAAVGKGYYLSFGQRTFRSPRTVRALREAPADRIFCETDDDQVAIGEIYSRVAGLRQTSVGELALQIIDNYEKLFEKR